MNNFFKGIGNALKYIVTLPAYVVLLAVFSVWTLIKFVILFFKSIFLFFTGRSLYEDLPQDKQASLIINRNKNLAASLVNQQNTPAQPATIVHGDIHQTIIQTTPEQMAHVHDIPVTPIANEPVSSIEYNEEPKEIIEEPSIPQIQDVEEAPSVPVIEVEPNKEIEEKEEVIERVSFESHIFDDEE